MLNNSSDYFTLMIPPLPEYRGSNYCKYKKGEKHITRIYFEYVLIFMFEETLYFTEDGKDVTLNKGNWYIQRPGLKQEGKIECPSPEYFYIHFRGVGFSPIYLNNYFQENPKTSGQISLPIRGEFEPNDYIELFNRLRSLSLNSGNYLLEQAVFLEILQKFYESTHLNQSKTFTLANQIATFLKKNYKKELNKNILEANFYYTYDYLSRIFKKEYRITPTQYIKDLKILKAKELLTHTEKTINNIIKEVGYHDETVFFKAFKKKIGVSPSIWRNINRFY